MNWTRMMLGLLAWSAVGWGFWLLAAGPADAAARQRWMADLWRYGQGPRRVLDLHLTTPREVALGDPVFVQESPGGLRQVGEITALFDQGQPALARQGRAAHVQAMLYPTAPRLSDQARLTYVSAPDSITWVVQTLLPPEKRAEIAAEISAAVDEHRDEILAELRPLAEESVRDALAILEQELPKAAARHRQELQAIGVRYHKDIVDRELAPLVREEIWPIVREHGEPAVNEVGREIWQRVSLWRFGWRFAYDRSPLPEKKLVDREWQRFVEEEAMPVLEKHSDTFLEVVQNSLRDIARNPQVRAVLRRSAGQVLEDPELQQVVWRIFREAAVDNPRLKESLESHWTGPRAQRAFRMAADRLEPTVRRIGERVLGSPEKGITPEFAQVLRHQVLHKDRRWFLLSDPSAP